MLRADLPSPRPDRGSKDRLGHSLPACLLGLALAMPGLAAAAPGLEYGPEAEANFLLRCAGTDATNVLAACRREMERLQVALGYPAFLEHAAEAADAYRETGIPAVVTPSIAMVTR